MIILHAGESEGNLVLWGEASRDDGDPPDLTAPAKDEGFICGARIRLPPALTTWPKP